LRIGSTIAQRRHDATIGWRASDASAPIVDAPPDRFKCSAPTKTGASADDPFDPDAGDWLACGRPSPECPTRKANLSFRN